MNNKDDYYSSFLCPVCGKEFWADRAFWVYRARMKKYRPPVIVCSYGCMRKAQADYEKNRHQGRKPRYKQTKEEIV